MASQTLFLDELIKDVDSLALLKELLDQYHDNINADELYDIPVLVPVLHSRIQLVVSAYATLIPFQTQAIDSFEQLIYQLQSIMENMANILAITTAAENSSKIQKLADKYDRQLQGPFARLKQLFLEFHTQTFKAAETDFESLQTTVATLEDLALKKLYETYWMIKQLEEVNKELSAFTRNTNNKKWRTELAASFKDFSKLYPEIMDWTNYIHQRKANNPLISDELVNAATKLETQLTSLFPYFNTVINHIYQYENRVEAVHHTISIYLYLSGKVKD